ncbi:Spermidine N(1)-acetyltransferase [Roseimaritima multifibrata]|uniref:Spermidine N(1)-acetyltransferase n=1 Tax=Roseimaritima multifibrata TaxID=1930274 RepID=A0A517MJQ7_9BACT|nr:GNAT family protein [Roseimaritima multifibrata]QDS95119.1 Spermidine N(1)-acetyltransferase [Roseimaritima multifibrata]
MNDRLPITTERLSLRRLQPNDTAALLAVYGNEDNARFEFSPAWSAEQVNDLIYSQSDVYLGDPGVPFTLAAIENASEALVGSVQITINSVEDRQGELGFAFNPHFGGRGLATEAVNAALGYAFSAMELHRIFAGVDTRNERSWRLMERIGMRREAHFIHASLEGDEWIDDFTYAMLEDEWQATNTT